MYRLYITALFCLGIMLSSPPVLANELDTLLQNMAKHSAKTQNLQANFVQKKQLSFLTQALQSKGHFFFTKNYQGQPAILWEYLSPAPSGILFQKNEGWIWLKDRSQLKKAQGYEGNVLNTMVKQILLWFTFEPSTLKKHYEISLDNTKNTIHSDCLNLIPNDNIFFSSMQLCIDNTNYTIKSLKFNEIKGDSTTLFFENIKLDKPYPSTFPDGTPFP